MTDYILLAICGFVVGFCISLMISVLRLSKHRVGTIRMDDSDPDEQPYLFLEVGHEGFAKIQKKKWIVMDVNLQSYLPREKQGL